MGPSPQPQERFLSEGKTHNPILFFLILIDPALKTPNYVKPRERQCGSKHKDTGLLWQKGPFFLAGLNVKVSLMDEKSSHRKMVAARNGRVWSRNPRMGDGGQG